MNKYDEMKTACSKYLEKHNYAQFNLRAVLFDMDGVLFDSMKAHARAWHECLTAEGLQCNLNEFYLYEGMVGSKTINLLMNRTKGRDASPEEQERLYAQKTVLFNKYNAGDLIPFAYQCVAQVRDDGLGRVLVTGSGQYSLFDKLDGAFPQLFTKERMVTAYDVQYGKPHPEPYLMGLAKAGKLEPNEAIVIENAPMGVEAAVSAGIFTIAVNTGPMPDKVLASAGANIVLPSMEALYTNWPAFLAEWRG